MNSAYHTSRDSTTNTRVFTRGSSVTRSARPRCDRVAKEVVSEWEEPCTLTLRLATAIGARDYDAVDREMLSHLPEFNTDALAEWLRQEGVPDCCVLRVLRFLKRHREGNYEEATFLGVPLLDEVAKYFYEKKDFTTKRGMPRPGIAVKTVNGPDLKEYCEAFVKSFGSLQEQSDPKRFADEDYWNRHPVVHGLMQRPMGLKDSAKCLMALDFLFSARKQEEAVAA